MRTAHPTELGSVLMASHAAVEVRRPRGHARVRPVSARIAPHVRRGTAPAGGGPPRIPIEALVAWALAGTALLLALLIADT